MSDDAALANKMTQAGILGVVSSDAAANAERPPKYSSEDRARAQLIQAYGGVLGTDVILTDALEALTKVGLDEDGKMTAAAVAAALSTADLQPSVFTASSCTPDNWPALAQMYSGQFVLVLGQTDAGLRIYDSAETDNEMIVPADEFEPYFTGLVVRAETTLGQLRKTHIKTDRKLHWFWGQFLKYRTILGDIVMGSLVANMLAVSVALFSLQVYDRVIPHESTATLWVLATGAFVALGLEALLKISRARLMDGAGRAIELKVQDTLMRRILGMRSDRKPMPSSSLFASMREFASVREFFTASTIGALADIPFIVIFLALVASIGGHLVWVLILGGILMVLPGYFLQRKMLQLTRDAQGANAQSSRLLQEAIFELDTVKAHRAEDRVQRVWNELNGLSSVTSSEQRRLASALTFWSQGVQQATYVTAVIVGTFMVFAGSFTVGSIIAIGILTSRTLAPLTQLAGTMARWSNVKTALDGLEMVMDAEQEVQEDRTYLRREKIAGSFEIREMTFRYEEDGPPTLEIGGVSIEAGQNVAVLGTNGQGKSTLLKIMSGLYAPTSGRVLLDGVDIGQIEPRDIRRAVGYLSQDVRLFAGTLRDNLNLNQLERDDDRLFEALDFAGLGPFVRAHHKGLDLGIRDGGEGMSVGQRQSIGWARMWLQDPSVVLLDEPTAALDQTLESALIRRLERWLDGRTAIIATHRVPILQLTERTFILQNGRLAVDGPRDAVLAHLNKA
ncbi:MAG: ATP-binding cassette domain-containing protein, partial [Pseudomonadota bacterium]